MLLSTKEALSDEGVEINLAISDQSTHLNVWQVISVLTFPDGERVFGDAEIGGCLSARKKLIVIDVLRYCLRVILLRGGRGCYVFHMLLLLPP